MPEKRGISAGDISRLLNAREERACVQGFLTRLAGIDFAAQVSLNIPGLPKNVPGDSEAVFSASGVLLERLGASPSVSVQLRNHAGFALLMSFRGDAARAKEAAVSVEEDADWGRVFDIDVITAGGTLSREGFGRETRKCFLCSLNAKECARAGTHGMEKLREEALRLLARVRRRT
jgi:holo-ACP synthase CitX